MTRKIRIAAAAAVAAASFASASPAMAGYTGSTTVTQGTLEIAPAGDATTAGDWNGDGNPTFAGAEPATSTRDVDLYRLTSGAGQRRGRGHWGGIRF